VTSDFNAQEWAWAMGLYKRRIYVSGYQRVFRPFSGTDKWTGLVAAYFTGPPPADEQLNNEINKIDNLPGLSSGTKQSLNAKLQSALASIAAGDTTSACNNLNAFINLVQAQYTKKKLTTAQANQLIADATAIMATLHCPPPNLQLVAERAEAVDLSQGPTKFAVEQNWPNPSHGSTNFSYALPIASKVSLEIYNVQGRRVATVVNEIQNPGWKSVTWNASGLPNGVYYYRITAGTFSETHKMLLMR
jgi:hypothetical protein